MSWKIYCFITTPREDLIADDKVPWREFNWRFGKLDGELEVDKLHPPVARCGQIQGPFRRHHGDDDDHDDTHRRPRTRDLLGRMSSWMEGRGKSREGNNQRSRGNGWYPGESSQGRTKRCRVGHACNSEKKELGRESWQFGQDDFVVNDPSYNRVLEFSNEESRDISDAIVIEPQEYRFS
jgi:hypothetical protein